MTTEKRVRRKYTENFKRAGVALMVEQGYKVTEAARSLDIGNNLRAALEAGFGRGRLGCPVKSRRKRPTEAAAEREPQPADGKRDFKKASQYFAKEMK